MLTIEATAVFISESSYRTAGTLHAAFLVTDGDTSGVAYYEYEWDKRDVVQEQLTAEPAVADALREVIGENGPQASHGAFSQHISKGDAAVRRKAQEKATEPVYDYH